MDDKKKNRIKSQRLFFDCATPLLTLFTIFTLFTILLLRTSPVLADEVYTFVIKKSENKQKYSWWLSDWLDKREKVRMMDLWLALHTPTPFEFFIGGALSGGNSSSPNGSFTGSDLHIGAFASIAGLEVHRDSTQLLTTTGTFDLRIFGFHDQGTNITLQAGLRSVDLGSDSTRNFVLGARMNLYLGRHFGLNGLYQNFGQSTPNSTGISISGYRLEGGAFIDFSALRLYGSYFSEPTTQTMSTLATSLDVSKSGFIAGARLYF